MASCKFEGGKYKGASEVKAHFRHNDIDPGRRAVAKKKISISTSINASIILIY